MRPDIERRGTVNEDSTLPSGAIILACVIAGCMMPSQVSAAGLDGQWWQGVPEAAKISVVQGMISAFYSGYLSGHADATTRASKPITKAWENHEISWSLYQKLWNWESLSVNPGAVEFSKTFETYVHQLDDFYVANPQAIRVNVGIVLRCLSDKPGETCEYIARHP